MNSFKCHFDIVWLYSAMENHLKFCLPRLITNGSRSFVDHFRISFKSVYTFNLQVIKTAIRKCVEVEELGRTLV